MKQNRTKTRQCDSRTRRIVMAAAMILALSPAVAQTTLVAPGGSGGFEAGANFAANGWTVENYAGFPNKWFVGPVATASAGSNCAYLSNDVSGATYTNYTAAPAKGMFWRDVTFPAGETFITLSFNIKVGGETDFDDLSVFIQNGATVPNVATAPATSGSSAPAIAGTTRLATMAQIGATYVTRTYVISAADAGNAAVATTRRLIFYWENDGIGATTAPPPAIDEISLVSQVPPAMTYVSSTTTQASAAVVLPASTDQQILRTEVVTNGLTTPLTLTQLNYNTAGTTNPATAISNAKVYYTDTSATFSTATPFGTAVANPNGTFTITGSQILSSGTGLADDSHYFWLVYDMNCSATPTEVVDAQCTGLVVGGTPQTPAVTNPAGSRTIDPLFTATRSDANGNAGIQSHTASSEFVYAAINGQPSCPGTVSVVNFTVSGAAAATVITNARCFYTNTATFSTANPFGSAIANPAAGAISFNDTRLLAPGANYFWLQYELSSCGITANQLIDGDVTSLVVNGNTVVPGGAATVGNNLNYPAAVNNVIFAPAPTPGAQNRRVMQLIIPACGSSSTVTDLAFNIAGTDPADITGANVYFTSTATFATSTPFGTAVPNPTGSFTISGNQPVTGNFNYFWLVYDIACTAIPGHTLDAACTGITQSGFTLVPTTTNPLGTFTIAGNPLIAQSDTTDVGPGSIDQQIIRANITGCVNSPVTSITFNTTGSTSTADIAAARVYYTPTTTFSTDTPFGTDITNPGAVMTFTDNVQLSTGTGYFWLVYDIAADATLGNIVDATCSSVTRDGVTLTPANSSPLGSRTIALLDMTFAEAFTQQTSIDPAMQGSTDQLIIRAVVGTSGINNPISLTQLDFNTNGSSNPSSDIASAKVYYTGTSDIFNTDSLFGSAVANPNGNFTVTGAQLLAGDTSGITYNYFWLVYDLNCNAVIADSLDAQCTGLTVGGSPQIPTETNPDDFRTVEPLLFDITRSDPNGIVDLTATTVSSVFAAALVNAVLPCAGTVSAVNFEVSGASAGTVITNARCFYTTTATFSTANPFGSAIANPAAGPISFTDTRLTAPGDNYFWLQYELSSCGLTSTQQINGDVTSLVINGNTTAVTGAATTENSLFHPQPSNNVIGISAASPGTQNRVVMQLLVSACSTGSMVTDFALGLAGTNPADISSAEVYYTTTSTFATTNLFGSMANPTGTFTISGNQPITGGNNWFWLVYDIACTAIPGHSFDAICTGVTQSGYTLSPNVQNPALSGNITGSPTVVQSSTASVDQGSTDERMLRMAITRCVNTPITSITFNTAGSTNAADITAARVYYTTTTTFSNATLFGTAISNPSGAMVFTGNQPLTTGTGHFWLVYDISPIAIDGNVVDATCNSVAIDGISITPASPNPAGSRPINAVPLPVMLKNFSGENAGPVNNLDWETATEHNFSHFELQRSADGIRFSNIDRIESKDNGFGGQYTYTDAMPLEGINIYRLKMVDLDGRSSLSPAISLTVKGDNNITLRVYPNPVKQELHISVAGKASGQARILVLDITGKVVASQNMDSSAADINMAHLPAGIYLVKYADSSHSTVVKVTKE